MATKKVVVTGGGNNLYRIYISGSRHVVSQVDVNLFSDDINVIGEARTMEDTLNIIKSHSGKSIENISNW